MLYKALGMLVWKVARLVLRRRYGRRYLPTPVLAGGAVGLVLGLLGLVRAIRG